jgi:hypothetical protein
VLFACICSSSIAFVSHSLRVGCRHRFTTVASTPHSIEPTDAVKIFGRLAEKFILLDASAGMCCYSACSDCEYRLPGGGYRMADQSSARPKWIPAYRHRSGANGRDHTSIWSAELFTNRPSVSKVEFVETIQGLSYAPPLGGPYVSASAATVHDTVALEAFFDVLANGKQNLTINRMSARLKQLADGEEGLTWAGFQRALGIL